MTAIARSTVCAVLHDDRYAIVCEPGLAPAADEAALGRMHRHAWNSVTGKLSTSFNAQAEKAVGLFSSRAANPVVQAASADSTEAVVWEVRHEAALQGHLACLTCYQSLRSCMGA